MLVEKLKSLLEAHKLQHGNDKISIMFSKDNDGESFIAVILPKAESIFIIDEDSDCENLNGFNYCFGFGKLIFAFQHPGTISAPYKRLKIEKGDIKDFCWIKDLELPRKKRKGRGSKLLKFLEDYIYQYKEELNVQYLGLTPSNLSEDMEYEDILRFYKKNNFRINEDGKFYKKLDFFRGKDDITCIHNK